MGQEGEGAGVYVYLKRSHVVACTGHMPTGDAARATEGYTGTERQELGSPQHSALVHMHVPTPH